MGGHLTGLFGTESVGYKHYNVPKPAALLLGYPINDMTYIKPIYHVIQDIGAYGPKYYTRNLSDEITPDYPATYHWHGVNDTLLKELVYCEVMGRTLTFHLNSGVVLESMGRLDDLCDQLVEYPNFLRPHRSFLINMEYIANIAARSITMQDGAVVPLPHGKYSETKDRYLSYIFDRKQVVM